MISYYQDLLFEGSINVLDSLGQYLEFIVVVIKSCFIDVVLKLAIELNAHSIL